MIQPNFISFMDWAASMVVDYPAENVPILYNEEEWKSWGNTLIRLNTFLINNAPGTDAYTDKWAWANDVYSTMVDTP